MFGIIFIVFTVLAAVVNYEFDTVAYSSAVPASFIVLSLVTAMLPFLISGVLSFSLAALISRAIKEETEKEKEAKKTETQTKREAEFEEIYK